MCVCVRVCVCVYLLLVKVQQYEHLQRGDEQRPAAEGQLSVTEPCPLEPPRLTTLNHTVHHLG